MESSGGKETEDLGSESLELLEKENLGEEFKESDVGFDSLIENPIKNGQLPENDAKSPTETQFDQKPSFVGPPRELNSEFDGKNDEESVKPPIQVENAVPCGGVSNLKVESENGGEQGGIQSEEDCFAEVPSKEDCGGEVNAAGAEELNRCFLLDPSLGDGYESGSEEEQAAFMSELANFFRERGMEFKPPKFYGIALNCLKLWRLVIKLGGYDTVTSCKLWRQVGESFKPPKTCTTVSWSFRCFYEKALLDYERHKIHSGELSLPTTPHLGSMSVENQVGSNQALGSGRARRDAAARAMQGWHSQRLLGNGEDKNSVALPRREKHYKSLGGVLKRKKSSSLETAVKAARTKGDYQQMDVTIVDVGPRADWVKVNVRRTKDCFEIYALVPGLLREEVRVQTDPAGRLVVSGKPEQLDNPWGVTPFQKVITLPSRIDPHQTSAVVTLHGQLFVRAPFEQSNL